MDIKDLNKTQLILLTLLITFVVSIATGIITVSLMQQMPKSIPQTINTVIQRTIEKVTTPVSAPTVPSTRDDKNTLLIGDSDVIVPIYAVDEAKDTQLAITDPKINAPKMLGEGIIISDIGLILVDSDIVTTKTVYRVVLNKTDFNATVLKKFPSGFTILKIMHKKVAEELKTDPSPTPTVDIIQ